MRTPQWNERLHVAGGLTYILDRASDLLRLVNAEPLRSEAVMARTLC